jgi:hypothetical protein
MFLNTPYTKLENMSLDIEITPDRNGHGISVNLQRMTDGKTLQGMTVGKTAPIRMMAPKLRI